MTTEVKTKNQEITSKWSLSCSWFYESNYVPWHRFEQNALAQHAKKHIVELQKDRDLWKDRCTQMVCGIGPVLDLLDPGLPPEEPWVQQ
jgi:hypothetical protein